MVVEQFPGSVSFIFVEGVSTDDTNVSLLIHDATQDVTRLSRETKASRSAGTISQRRAILETDRPRHARARSSHDEKRQYTLENVLIPRIILISIDTL